MEFTGVDTDEGMPQRQSVSIALRQTVGDFIVIPLVGHKDMLFQRHCCGAGDGTESKAGGVLIMGLPKQKRPTFGAKAALCLRA